MTDSKMLDGGTTEIPLHISVKMRTDLSDMEQTLKHLTHKCQKET